MKRKKRLVSLTALVLALSMLSVAVLADTYDVDNGKITINATSTETTVQQGAGAAKADNDITITGSTTKADAGIIINVGEKAHADVTFDNVNMNVGIAAGNPVKVIGNGDDASATLTFTGKNTIKNQQEALTSVVCRTSTSLDITIKGEDNAELNVNGIANALDFGKSTSVETVSITIEDMTINSNSAILVVGSNMGGLDTEINIKDSEVNAKTIYINDSSAEAGNSTINIENSEITVSGTKSNYGVSVVNTSSATSGSAEININSSTVKASCKDDGIAAIFAGTSADTPNASINLENCELQNSAQTLGEASVTAGTKTFNGVAVMNGTEVAKSTKIVTASESKTGKGISSTANEDGTFTIKGVALVNFQNVKVDGKRLAEGDFTLTEAAGGLKLVFADAFLAGLASGSHTVEINFGKPFAIFTLTK